MEEDKDGKIICEKIIPFENLQKKVWIKFPTMDDFKAKENALYDALKESEGDDIVVIYIENPKAMKELPRNQRIKADDILVGKLEEIFGRENVKVVQK